MRGTGTLREALLQFRPFQPKSNPTFYTSHRHPLCLPIHEWVVCKVMLSLRQMSNSNSLSTLMQLVCSTRQGNFWSGGSKRVSKTIFAKSKDTVVVLISWQKKWTTQSETGWGTVWNIKIMHQEDEEQLMWVGCWVKIGKTVAVVVGWWWRDEWLVGWWSWWNMATRNKGERRRKREWKTVSVLFVKLTGKAKISTS